MLFRQCQSGVPVNAFEIDLSVVSQEQLHDIEVTRFSCIHKPCPTFSVLDVYICACVKQDLQGLESPASGR